MGLNLETIIAAGEAAILPVEDIVADVKAGIAEGGGVAAEALAVTLKLCSDTKFQTHVAALVAAIKAL